MVNNQYVVDVFVAMQKVQQIVTDSLELAHTIAAHITDDVYEAVVRIPR